MLFGNQTTTPRNPSRVTPPFMKTTLHINPENVIRLHDKTTISNIYMYIPNTVEPESPLYNIEPPDLSSPETPRPPPAKRGIVTYYVK